MGARVLGAGAAALLVLGWILPPSSRGAAGAEGDIPAVRIDYFFEPGCHACERVRREVLPELGSRFESFYELHSHDVGAPSNVALLVAFQKALGMSDNEPVSMVVDYRYPLSGVTALKTGLVDRVEASILERLEPGWQPPAPIAAPVAADRQGMMAEHAATFALLAVLGGGLVDGINPCAISSLVFFMSLLAVARVKGRGLLLMGVAFCLASFLTYTALGFGLLQVLHAFSGFTALRAAVEVALVGCLGVLAFLSFRDARRYRRTGRAADVSLQLPDGIKRRIHEVMRARLRTGNLVLGGLAIGAAVTALESVCTGQVYVPTLVVVIRSGRAGWRAWTYLLLYNLMFILPLAVVFTLTYCGLETGKLLAWSKRNVVASKMLLGSFFLAMALLLLVL